MLLKVLRISITIGLFISAMDVSAVYPKTEKDFAFLPPFCKAKLRPSSPAETKLWSRKLGGGDGFGHTHHFCKSLHSLRLAKKIKRNSSEKRWHLQEARTGIEYMEKHAPPEYVLFPYIYTTRAEIYFLENKNGDAIKYLYKAMQHNKKFVKSYILLAKFYLKSGSKKDAIEILNEGLKYSPNSKRLKRALARAKKN